jgi:hypothetical protein
MFLFYSKKNFKKKVDFDTMGNSMKVMYIGDFNVFCRDYKIILPR